MCYHISIPGSNNISMEFDWSTLEDDLEPFHHLSGFSFEKTPVITNENQNRIQFFNWGLIPRWVKDWEQAAKMRQWCLNATSENVFDKPSFKNSIEKKRCLIIVDGFYEWREFKGKKFPYFIFLKNRKAFALAGIYDQWADKNTGEIFNTYSIITTTANALMEKIHNVKKRMPVILEKEDEKIWLKNDLGKENSKNLLIPYNENQMEAYTISKLIISRIGARGIKDLKEKYLYDELPDLKELFKSND